MSSIRLSEKNGVNPTIPICFFCGEAKNEVALLGAQGDKIAKAMGNADGAMPMHVCMDDNPCDKCAKHMKQGIMIIGVRDGESGDNPYRNGMLFVVTEDCVRGLLEESPELLADVLKRRMTYMEEETIKAIGLDKQGDTDADTTSR